MEYQFSTLIDPSTYDDFGLCGALPLRHSNYSHLADEGCRSAQEDWNRLVGRISNFHGCLSPRFNAIAVAFPECFPDRIALIAYANEFAFLQDGMAILARNNVVDTDLKQM